MAKRPPQNGAVGPHRLSEDRRRDSNNGNAPRCHTGLATLAVALPALAVLLLASLPPTGASAQAPTVANAIPDQRAAVGRAFSYTFPADTFDIVVDATDVCFRTPEVRDAIVRYVGFVRHNIDCTDVTPSDLTGLTRLQISSKSSLTSLKAGDFSELTNLEVLFLNINQLTTLPAGIDRLTKLEVLDLRGIRLTTLPANIFDRLTNLQKLYLDENPGAPLYAPFRPTANAGDEDQSVSTGAEITLSGTATGATT